MPENNKKNVWLKAVKLLNQCRSIMLEENPYIKATDEYVITEALRHYKQSKGRGEKK